MQTAPILLDFGKAAVAAFPAEQRAIAERAGKALLPFVNDSYRKTPIEMIALGRPISVPRRVHYEGLDLASLDVATDAWLAANCLCTRSTDGYLRHAALRNIVRSRHKEVIPFVVLLAGDYVIEIVSEIAEALPTIDQPAYANFARENRPLMRRLRAMATSHWNANYRADFNSPTKYPGLIVLHAIERWAS